MDVVAMGMQAVMKIDGRFEPMHGASVVAAGLFECVDIATDELADACNKTGYQYGVACASSSRQSKTDC